MTVAEIRDAIEALEHTAEGDSNDAEIDAGHFLKACVLELLDEPTNVQALALAQLIRDRPNAQVVVHTDVFDLPNGYWLAIIGTDGFQCGIAPNGDVSS